MKLRATFVFEYELTDDLGMRRFLYGTVDPEECAKVDYESSPDALFNSLVITEISPTEYKVEVVKEDAKL